MLSSSVQRYALRGGYRCALRGGYCWLSGGQRGHGLFRTQQGLRVADDGYAYTYTEFIDHFGPRLGPVAWRRGDVYRRPMTPVETYYHPKPRLVETELLDGRVLSSAGRTRLVHRIVDALVDDATARCHSPVPPQSASVSMSPRSASVSSVLTESSDNIGDHPSRGFSGAEVLDGFAELTRDDKAVTRVFSLLGRRHQPATVPQQTNRTHLNPSEPIPNRTTSHHTTPHHTTLHYTIPTTTCHLI